MVSRGPLLVLLTCAVQCVPVLGVHDLSACYVLARVLEGMIMISVGLRSLCTLRCVNPCRCEPVNVACIACVGLRARARAGTQVASCGKPLVSKNQHSRQGFEVLRETGKKDTGWLTESR